MKNYYLLIISFIFFNSFLYANDTSYVYCSNNLQYLMFDEVSDWRWLKDDDGDYIKIKGSWNRHLVPIRRAYFMYFKVDRDDFKRAVLMCKKKHGKIFTAAPADSAFSSWRVFGYLDKGKMTFSDGPKTLIGLTVIWVNEMVRG